MFRFAILPLLECTPAGCHLLQPSRLAFVQQLQQNVIAIERQDWSYISWMQPGEAVLKIFSEIREDECTKVSSRTGRRVGGVLPGEVFKGLAVLDASAQIPGLAFCFYDDHPQTQVLRRGRDHKRHNEEHKDRKSTRLNSSHRTISYAVFCLKKKKKNK